MSQSRTIHLQTKESTRPGVCTFSLSLSLNQQTLSNRNHSLIDRKILVIPLKETRRTGIPLQRSTLTQQKGD